MNTRVFSLAAALFVFSAFFSVPVLAQESSNSVLGGTVSANVGLYSDYVFRGITQSDEHMAVQGGVDYAADVSDTSSVYLGTWASNVDFNDGDEASVEVDLYGGVNFAAGPVDLSLGALYYAYPGADDSLNYDFWEFQAKASHDFGPVVLDAGINYSPNFFADSGDAVYYQANATVPLPHDFSFKAHAGYQAVDDNAAFLYPDYTDWSLGAAYSYEGFNFSLSYIDTDMSKTDCADGCESRVVFGISKSF